MNDFTVQIPETYSLDELENLRAELQEQVNDIDMRLARQNLWKEKTELARKIKNMQIVEIAGRIGKIKKDQKSVNNQFMYAAQDILPKDLYAEILADAHKRVTVKS